MQQDQRHEMGNGRAHSADQEAQLEGRTWHPHALLVQWEIYTRTGQWLAACAVAQALVLTLPDQPIGWLYRAFALSKLGRLQEARQTLLPAARKFSRDWRIPYYLACYNCQLGDVAGAWNWLDHAITLGNADLIKSQALDEEGLKPLWARLGKV